ncbi:hypothetical protein ACNQKP_13170 [Bdellovibrio bacteriovorus]|uniref:hypothetical protein n=1 Tax=Bdellovibrio bacteriovorus TaxID=959 RepID=UPI003AA864EB
MLNVEVNARKRHGSRGHLSLLFGLTLMLAGPLAHAACIVENEEKVQINISPETKSWGDYRGQETIDGSRIVKCQEEAGRFLMLSLGAVQWGSSSEVKDSYIFNSFDPGTCSLENSRSISSYLPQVTKANFERQYKFLRSCIDLRVADTRGGALVVNEKQPFCDVTRIDNSAVLMRGSMCFIKIRAQNDYAVQPILKKECLDPSYLDAMGIEAQDIYANLDTLVTGDESGSSTDVRHVGSRPFHINITPKSGLLPLSEDFGAGIPRFTTTYTVDGDWGPVSIRSRQDRTQIDLSFLVSNIADRSCEGSSCSSSSNFMQPFVGQVELFRLRDAARPELIEEWWDGGLVPPNWQGVMNGISYRVPDRLFTPGGKYRLVATFQDPTDDYAIYLNGLKQMLVRLFDTEGATVGVDTLPAISTLGDLGIIPGINGMGGLHSNNQTVSLAQTMEGLEGIIASTVWPPYYDRACAGSESCMRMGKRKFHQRLILEFTADMDPSGGDVELANVRMQKNSPVFKSYPMQSGDFPILRCER